MGGGGGGGGGMSAHVNCVHAYVCVSDSVSATPELLELTGSELSNCNILSIVTW